MLTVDALRVAVGPASRPLDIVRGVSLQVAPGEVLALVGESGSGKSLTSLAVMGLLPDPGPRVRQGRIELDGADVTHEEPWQRVAGGHGNIAMVFQEPMTSLNPVTRVGAQIAEAIRVHDPEADVEARVRELLTLVHIPDAALQTRAYPHELSGGMRQRVMIAIALACRPRFLIADEPTTALDVTVQMQILALLRELCERLGMGMLFITHDLGVVAQLADRVAVMYAGEIVEQAPVDDLFAAPIHPYTAGLIACVPDPESGQDTLYAIPGQAPQPSAFPDGCAFAPRCERAIAACRTGPVPVVGDDTHWARCHVPLRQEDVR